MSLNKGGDTHAGLHDGLHQRFCKEPECPGAAEGVGGSLPGAPSNTGPPRTGADAKLADLENELQEEISLESFLSGFKLALGIAAELAPSYSFDDDEERQACEVLRQRRGE